MNGRPRVRGTVFRVLLSAMLLGLLAYIFRGKLPEVGRVLAETRPWPLALAAGWYVLFIIISSWRWKILLGARGLGFSTWYLARVFTLSLFFCKLLPTSIGGDVFRIAYTAPRNRTAEAFSATLLDRLIGFQSLVFLALAVSLGLFAFSAPARLLELPIAGIRFRGFGIAIPLLIGLMLLLFVTLVFFNDRAHRVALRFFGRGRLRRVGERIDRVYAAVKAYRGHPRALLLSFMSGIGVQAALAASWYSIAAALGGTVPAVYYFVFIPLLNIVVNIPTIGGLGVREWAFVLFLTPDWLAGSLAPELALAAAVLFLALDLVFALTGGVLFAVMRRQTEVPGPAGDVREVRSRVEKENGDATRHKLRAVTDTPAER